MAKTIKEMDQTNKTVEENGKVFLTERELEKIGEVQNLQKEVINISSQLGLMTLGIDELKSLLSKHQIKLNEENSKLEKELGAKYGQFQLGQDGEVITLKEEVN